MSEEPRSTSFDPDAFARAREELGAVWGRPLRYYEETTSTSDRALEEVDTPMKTGGVFVADRQSGGRGRRGSAWLSAPGENLTFSVLLRLPIPPEKTATLALVVGLAVRATAAHALLDRGAVAKVKWPNDVLVDERKLAGILVETRFRGGETTAIVGVGLNVAQREFPGAAGNPTSLALLGVPAALRSRERLLAVFLRELEERMGQWLARGFAASLEEFRAHDALVGRDVLVDERRGTARGVSASGELFLELDDGSLLTLTSGHVSLPAPPLIRD